MIDPGWLFVIAGVAMLAAALLIPARIDLQQMVDQRDRIRHNEYVVVERLERYDMLLSELERGEDVLLRRLALTQLNKLPEGEEPILVSGTFDLPITRWVDASINEPPPEPTPVPDSTLTELVSGENRLWVIAGSVFCVFVGLVLNTGEQRARSRTDDDVPSAG